MLLNMLPMETKDPKLHQLKQDKSGWGLFKLWHQALCSTKSQMLFLNMSTRVLKLNLGMQGNTLSWFKSVSLERLTGGQPKTHGECCLRGAMRQAKGSLDGWHEYRWNRDAALSVTENSLGHGLAVQACVSLPFPSQSLPPSWGTGALQCRILVICPSPQVTEQDDHGDHKLQPPSWRTGF